MKNYLLVLSCMELGGAERQAINFAKYLQKAGNNVTILGFGNPGIVCEMCDMENIPWLILTRGNKWLSRILSFVNLFTNKVFKIDIWPHGISVMYELAKYIKKNKYDVCISYCAYANTILGFSKKFYKNCIYVWFQRDAGIFDSTGGYQKIAIRMVDFVFANSQSGKEWIKKGYGIDATLVYNGVSLKQPQKSACEWMKILNVNNSDIVCTMVANLSGAKDHMSLLKIWKLLYELNQECHLTLVFAGRFDDQYKNLYSYAAENGLLPYVRFLGQVTDIEGLLCVTSICVFGAISEGSPNGIIESAMMGLPVVATDLPEIREIVDYGNYKYLFNKGDIESAANKILLLAEDSKLRKYLGEKNKEKAIRMFSTESNFSKLMSIIEGKSK